MDSLEYQIQLLTHKTTLITAWASLIGSIAYPLVILAVFLIFRSHIIKLIPKIRKATLGATGLEFDPAEVAQEHIKVIDKSIEPIKAKAEKVTESLVNNPDLDKMEKKKLTSYLFRAGEQISRLESEKRQLIDQLLENQRGLDRIVSVDRTILSSTKQRAAKEVIQVLGVDNVLSWSADELKFHFDTIAKEMRLHPDKKHPFPRVYLTGLWAGHVLTAPDGIMTPLGISLFKALAKEMKDEQEAAESANPQSASPSPT